MSASPVARQVISQAIPVTRRVAVNHESELPNDLSSTPGGSLFSTTPGGTRVYYDRNFLLSMRNSPLARTPPANLPVIRGVTVPNIQPTEAIQEEDNEKFEELHDDEDTRLSNSVTRGTVSSSPPKDKDDDAQFQLDL